MLLLQPIRTFTGYHYDTAEQGHQGHAQRIFAIKYHPEIESVFVSAGWDNCLKVSCRISQKSLF